MANKDFPRIPAKNWWMLRRRFKQSMPPSISINYLASLLEITERGAQNYMPHFKLVKIIDEDGKTNERTSRWRDDEEYSAICNQIKSEIYSEELQSLVPDPVIGFDTAVSWFMRETGVGEAAAKQMSRFYQLISKADPSDGEEVPKKSATKKAKKTDTLNKAFKAKKEKPAKNNGGKGKNGQNDTKQFNFQPSVNINIQIHISPDASTKQIDDIFKCMSDHFRKMAIENE